MKFKLPLKKNSTIKECIDLAETIIKLNLQNGVNIKNPIWMNFFITELEQHLGDKAQSQEVSDAIANVIKKYL